MVWRKLFLLHLLVLSVIACEKIEVYHDNEIEVENAKKRLANYRDKSVSVDSFKNAKGLYQFSFSDGTEIKIDGSDIPVLTIDIMGYWRVNDERIQESLDVSGIDIIHSLNADGLIQGILEGYTDWSFIFNDGTVIALRKALFASDPDLLVRGINHRGYSREAPENTLPAYRLSRLKGFRYVETDIHFTADGVPVLIHDGTVDRTSDGSGSIKDMEWNVVRSMDFGSWKNDEFAGTTIPSLEEFLALCRQIDLWPYIELKEGTKEQIGQIVSLVEKYDLRGKAVYISFSSVHLQYVMEFDPSATIGFLLSTVTEGSIQTALDLKTETNSVFIDTSDRSEVAISLCRNASLPMEVWTVNSKSTILSMDGYITGVTSDYLHAGRILENNSR